MQRMLILILTAGLALSLCAPGTAVAGPSPEPTPGYRGLGLSTPFPSQTVRAGEPVTLALTVRNYGMAPQVATLAVTKGAPGWKVSFLGAGRTVTAVAVGTDQEASLSVRLDPPAGARAGTYRFLLTAQGQGAAAELPLALTLGQVLPGRLDLQAELPVLRGPGTSSFRYRLTLNNESEKDMLVSLEARMPKGFQVAFTPAFASQQVTSLPVKAGESRDLDAEVTLPQDVAAGTHALSVRAISGEARAEVKLTIEVTGRPDLSITTPDGRLSGRAYAGRDTPIKVVVKNLGTSPARGIEVSSYEPTGWQVKFDPSRIEEIAPKGEAQVTATVRPSSKAIAGDYMLTLRATAGDSSSSADFRVTVFTSTLWGIVGVVVIAVALGVVSLVVSRYGRR